MKKRAAAILLSVLTVLMTFAGFTSALTSEASGIDDTYPDSIPLSWPDYDCGIVNKKDSATLEKVVVDGRHAVKITPKPECADAQYLQLEGWSIAAANIPIEKYNYVSVSYKYESDNPIATPMRLAFLDSGKAVIKTSVLHNSLENIRTGGWSVLVFDMTETREFFIDDGTTHALKQIHLYPFGRTPLSTLNADDALYIESMTFHKEMPDLGAHFSYMTGYTDGTFRPSGTITRAESCTVIARILAAESEFTGTSKFTDVAENAWYSKYIAFCEEKGLLDSYSGTFEPDKPITRAEFAELVFNAELAKSEGTPPTFSDVSEDHPKAAAIKSAAAAGLITGYSDGTFLPDRTINRAQAVTVINRALGRTITKDKISVPADKAFKDVDEAFWAYSDISEATVSHVEAAGEWSYLMDKEIGTETAIVEEVKAKAEARKNAILSTPSDYSTITGQKYYVANDGDDSNDGLSPEKPWKTLDKVTATELKPGDGVLFKRGDIWRGCFITKNGVTYSAYGEGDKPILSGSLRSGAVKEDWVLFHEDKATGAKIWEYTKATDMPDVGTVFFNEEIYAYKELPSYKNGEFVLRADNTVKFDVITELDRNFEFVHLAVNEDKTTDPVPLTARGPLYLRCDEGNPAELYESIEFNCFGNTVQVFNTNDVTIDNLCFMHTGSHGVSGMTIKNLTTKNCAFINIGGSIQSYTSGKPVRYGNAVQLYGEGDGFYVLNNYISHAYDAGATHQKSAEGTADCTEANCHYIGNLIEKCVYGIEYFMNVSPVKPDAKRIMENILIEDNYILDSGTGFGTTTRPDAHSDGSVKGWWGRNESDGFEIKNNIFMGSTTALIYLAAEKPEWLPVFSGNTYIQGEGNFFARYGSPKCIDYYNSITEKASLLKILGDESGKVYSMPYIHYPVFPFGE